MESESAKKKLRGRVMFREWQSTLFPICRQSHTTEEVQYAFKGTDKKDFVRLRYK